jgi:hypothetical protein
LFRLSRRFNNRLHNRRQAFRSPVAKCGEIRVTQCRCRFDADHGHAFQDTLRTSSFSSQARRNAATGADSSPHPFPSTPVASGNDARSRADSQPDSYGQAVRFFRSPETVDQQRENTVLNHRRHRNTLSALVLGLLAVPFCA